MPSYTTSNVAVTPGSGANVWTESFTDTDSIVKQRQVVRAQNNDGDFATLGATTDAPVDTVGATASIAGRLHGILKQLLNVVTNTNLIVPASADGKANTTVGELVPGLVGGAGTVNRWKDAGGIGADAQAGASIGSVGPFLWNGTTWDRAESLAASGFGLGALKVGPGVNRQGASVNQRNTSAYNLVQVSDAGVHRRAGVVYNNSDQSVTISLILTLGGYSVTVYSFALAANSTCYWSSAGVYGAGSSGASGTAALLDAPADSFTVQGIHAVAPTTNGVTAFYAGHTN